MDLRRRPRHERLLLALVAAVAFAPVYAVNAQDVSRLCLTRALVHGHVSADRCLAGAFDRASHGGHLYSDKAPGMSVLEIPWAEAFRIPTSEFMAPNLRLWAVRVAVSGLAFLVCLFLVGRTAEYVAPGTGPPAMVALALGTLLLPFAAANFQHVTAAALGFGAFLLAWSRRDALAGLVAGLALDVEYQSGLVLVVVAGYVALRSRRGLLAYAAAAVPGVALLAAYDTAAFGRPWRLSYQYVANQLQVEQSQGFFGIGVPHLFSTYEVFVGSGGLLIASPVLVLAPFGLVLLARRHRAEAVVCGVVALLFVLVNCGYFLPYGGVSPGPRFVIPALPFLAVGVACACAWRPRLTAILTLLSIVPTLGLTLIWAANPPISRSIWGELGRVVTHGESTRFVRGLTDTVYSRFGMSRVGAAELVALIALAAFVVGFARVRLAPLRLAITAPVAVALALVAAAVASAVAEVPYHGRTALVPSVIATSIQSTKSEAVTGDEVDFSFWATNPTPDYVDGVVMQIELPPGFRLLGLPYHERGPGCSGTQRIECDLDFLAPKMSTPVRLGVRVEPGAPQHATVSAETAAGGDRGRGARYTVTIGSTS